MTFTSLQFSSSKDCLDFLNGCKQMTRHQFFTLKEEPATLYPKTIVVSLSPVLEERLKQLESKQLLTINK